MNGKIINLDSIEKVLESDLSGYRIAQEVGLSRSAVMKYRNGESSVLNMTLDTGLKFTELGTQLENGLDDNKINSIEELEDYLENYPNSRSNSMDAVFSLFKSDVSKIAENYRKGEAYIYSKEDFLEEKNEIAEEYKKHLIDSGFTLEEILEEDKDYQNYSNIVEEVTRSKARFFIDEVGVTGFSEIL